MIASVNANIQFSSSARLAYGAPNKSYYWTVCLSYTHNLPCEASTYSDTFELTRSPLLIQFRYLLVHHLTNWERQSTPETEVTCSMVFLTVLTKLPVLAHVALFIFILFIYSFIFFYHKLFMLISMFPSWYLFQVCSQSEPNYSSGSSLKAEAHPPRPDLRLWSPGAPHQCRNHAAAPQQAPCHICQQPQRHRGEI